MDEVDKIMQHRQAAYGHPLDDFTCRAAGWRWYLLYRHGVDIQLTPEDVAEMEGLGKLAREINAMNNELDIPDNDIDRIGYIRTKEHMRLRRGESEDETERCRRGG